jgi:hypothetical protein
MMKNDTITFLSKKLTSRSSNSGPQLWYGPGDPYNDVPDVKALNANYQDVEAALIICNNLGRAGYKYYDDFYFVTCGSDSVTIQFVNPEAMTYAAMALTDAIGNPPCHGGNSDRWDQYE